MATDFEDLRVLQKVEQLADELWHIVAKWDSFAKDTVGKQLVRAVDSIGANISESFGRFHYGDKLNFLYYARGSIFETKYWINRCLARDLLSQADYDRFANYLNIMGKQVNTFANNIKQQKGNLREPSPDYSANSLSPFFTDSDQKWLNSPNPQSPISNLQSQQDNNYE